MRLTCRISILLMLSFVLAAIASGQEVCTFNIAGDWESTAPGETARNLYRFTPDGTVTIFSLPAVDGKARETARTAYKLNTPESPKTLEFKAVREPRAFPWGSGRMEILEVADNSLTVVKPGSAPVAWVRIDPDKYFVVVAAHRGTPPHFGGPAFVVLIKKPAASKMQIETFGLYYRDGKRINGPVPTELVREYMTDLSSDQDSVLRLEITAKQFSRAMKIVRTWQKRAAGGALLFPSYSYLNVVVPLKEVAESLNACGATINLHKLTWMVDDEIGANFGEWELSYQYVKKLRELNQRANLTDAKLQQTIGSPQIIDGGTDPALQK
jgi:hypothetical protein